MCKSCFGILTIKSTYTYPANTQFYEEHREARERFEAGDRDVEFPPGTYLMAKRFGVNVKKK